MISFNEISETIMFVFVIAILGYLLGSVKIKGLNLGNAGIFIIGLIFGHFGVILPAILQTLGAVFFITAVGFGAGPGFIRRLKRNGFSYAVLCLSTAAIGSIICWFIIRAVGIEAPLAVGIMTGAFTTSPGFAAAKEAAQSPAAAAQVAAGYGLVYPVGVTCKVLLIQLIPRFLRADMAFERTLIKDTEDGITGEEKGSHRIDKLGICFFH